MSRAKIWSTSTNLPTPRIAGSLAGAVGWMMGAVVSLTTIAVAGRALATEISIFEIMLFRNIICLIIICALVMRQGGHLFRTRRPRVHGIRNVVHLAAQGCWYYGLINLPLSEVFAIEFTAPLWTAILAALFLAERMNAMRVAGTVLGFAGIMIILRPGVAIIDPAAFVVLAAAVGFAATFVITKSLTDSEAALTIVFYMNLIQLPITLVLALPDWVAPSPALWPWVLVTGLAGLGSHYCFARAFALADAGLVAPIDFIRLPLAVAVGYLLYQEPTSMFVFLGAAVILIGNYLNIRGQRNG